MKIKQILPPTYLLAAIIFMLVIHFTLPISTLIPMPWNLLGLFPLFTGVAIDYIADSAFRRAGTTVKPFQESSVLITDGVYRISRHPMYLGFVLVLVGIACLFGSLSPWAIPPLYALLMDAVFIQTEERMLEEKFGTAWSEYKKKVRRWI